MIKVFFDHQMFAHQRIGGVSKYFAELLRNMPREMWTTSTFLSNNQYVKDYHLLKTKSLLLNKDFKGKGRLLLELGIPYTLYRLRRRDYDVYHQTHYESFSLIGLGTKPMVTTIHDMNFFTYNRNERLMRDTIKSINRADKIIAISNYTKDCVVNMLGVNPEKIMVIYHGIDEVDLSKMPEKRIFDFSYILYVGSRNQEFKNFKRFAKGFSILAEKYKDIHLVCSGTSFTKSESLFLHNLNIFDRCHTFFATEEEMQQLYRNAVMFVYPSFSEGFGMPILEAMQCGCPCVLANASCFPEIASQAAVFFDPFNVEDIFYNLETVLNDSVGRERLKISGFSRVANFSWKETANEHIILYKSLV